MNKQEAVKGIEDEKILGFTTYEDESYNEGLITALSYVEAIEVPEKPVVPQFVADWYEDYKGDLEFNIYNLCNEYRDNGEGVNKDLKEWFGNNSRTKPIETLVKMKLYGYEVKKEKLYTVEIPNPNGDGNTKTYLCENGDGKVELFTWYCYGAIETADNWKQLEYAQLTEDKIKEDYEWAWQFAEEVEE